MIRIAYLISCVALVLQTAAPPERAVAGGQPTPAATTAAQGQQKAGSAPQTPYSYNAEGRRDPFLSLVGRGNEPQHGEPHVAGLPGLTIGEASVKGILRSSTGFIAMVQAADNKTYIVHVGEKLADGTVKSITQDSVIFSQDVNDPLSLVKQREIRKTIRAAEGR